MNILNLNSLFIIYNNPVEIGFVDNPEEYVYSSARDYAEKRGLVRVTLPG